MFCYKDAPIFISVIAVYILAVISYRDVRHSIHLSKLEALVASFKDFVQLLDNELGAIDKRCL